MSTGPTSRFIHEVSPVQLATDERRFSTESQLQAAEIPDDEEFDEIELIIDEDGLEPALVGFAEELETLDPLEIEFAEMESATLTDEPDQPAIRADEQIAAEPSVDEPTEPSPDNRSDERTTGESLDETEEESLERTEDAQSDRPSYQLKIDEESGSVEIIGRVGDTEFSLRDLLTGELATEYEPLVAALLAGESYTLPPSPAPEQDDHGKRAYLVVTFELIAGEVVTTDEIVWRERPEQTPVESSEDEATEDESAASADTTEPGAAESDDELDDDPDDEAAVDLAEPLEISESTTIERNQTTATSPNSSESLVVIEQLTLATELAEISIPEDLEDPAAIRESMPVTAEASSSLAVELASPHVAKQTATTDNEAMVELADEGVLFDARHDLEFTSAERAGINVAVTPDPTGVERATTHEAQPHTELTEQRQSKMAGQLLKPRQPVERKPFGEVQKQTASSSVSRSVEPAPDSPVSAEHSGPNPESPAPLHHPDRQSNPRPQLPESPPNNPDGGRFESPPVTADRQDTKSTVKSASAATTNQDRQSSSEHEPTSTRVEASRSTESTNNQTAERTTGEASGRESIAANPDTIRNTNETNADQVALRERAINAQTDAHIARVLTEPAVDQFMSELETMTGPLRTTILRPTAAREQSGPVRLETERFGSLNPQTGAAASIESSNRRRVNTAYRQGRATTAHQAA